MLRSKIANNRNGCSSHLKSQSVDFIPWKCLGHLVDHNNDLVGQFKYPKPLQPNHLQPKPLQPNHLSRYKYDKKHLELIILWRKWCFAFKVAV